MKTKLKSKQSHLMNTGYCNCTWHTESKMWHFSFSKN